MGGYNIKKHKDEIITHIIKCVVWLPIASLLALIGAIIKTILDAYRNSEYSNNNIVILGLISCVISILSIIINLISIKRKKEISNKENTKQENGVVPINNFRINSVVDELLFTDRINIKSTLHYEMTANEDNIEYFEKELTWSGKKYYGTKLLRANGDYELEMFDSTESIHKYRVNFHNQIKCQDKLSFDLETEVSDDELKMLPISAYMVKHQIDELTIRVVVPLNCIKNVKKAIYLDMHRQLPVGNPIPLRKKMIAGKECYEFTVQNPTISHRYFIEWEFTN